MVQSFGRLFSLLTHEHREAAHLFQAVPEVIDDLLARWEWRLNLYYDGDVLILSHVIDPSLQFSRLNKDVFPPYELLGIIYSFENRCRKLCVDAIAVQISAKMELKQDFCQWIRLESSLAESMATEKDGFTWWLHCLDFPPTSIPRFFVLIFLSIAAGVADLKRV